MKEIKTALTNGQGYVDISGIADSCSIEIPCIFEPKFRLIVKKAATFPSLTHKLKFGLPLPIKWERGTDFSDAGTYHFLFQLSADRQYWLGAIELVEEYFTDTEIFTASTSPVAGTANATQFTMTATTKGAKRLAIMGSDVGNIEQLTTSFSNEIDGTQTFTVTFKYPGLKGIHKLTIYAVDANNNYSIEAFQLPIQITG